MIISRNNSEEYNWGNNCKGWHFVNNDRLSVISELMPPKTEETYHKHHQAQQFFFVLSGEANFIIEGKSEMISAHQGVHIPPGISHKIINSSEEFNLEFIVISEPHSHGDRELIP